MNHYHRLVSFIWTITIINNGITKNDYCKKGFVCFVIGFYTLTLNWFHSFKST